MNFFEFPIPRDVGLHELKFLSLRDQRRFAGVNKRCHALSEEAIRLLETLDVKTENSQFLKFLVTQLLQRRFLKLRCIKMHSFTDLPVFLVLLKNCPNVEKFVLSSEVYDALAVCVVPTPLQRAIVTVVSS